MARVAQKRQGMGTPAAEGFDRGETQCHRQRQPVMTLTTGPVAMGGVAVVMMVVTVFRHAKSISPLS